MVKRTLQNERSFFFMTNEIFNQDTLKRSTQGLQLELSQPPHF